jgi:hypothetical protein
MAHLGEIENQLNSDPKARQAFLADPAGFLMAHGIVLSPAQAQSLREFNYGITAPGEPVAGASIGQARELKLVIRAFAQAQR